MRACVLVTCVFFATAVVAVSPLRISCIGDSITQGGCMTKQTYPDVLQWLLGTTNFTVTNFGNSGHTMLRKGLCGDETGCSGDCSYWNTQTYTDALASQPDIVTIMLGTNDAKTCNWLGVQQAGDSYEQDYLDMVAAFKNLPSKPKVYLLVPPPLYPPFPYGMNQTVINSIYPSLTRKIASQSGDDVHVIDVFESLGGAGLLFPSTSCDGCHPVEDAYVIIAHTIAQALVGSPDVHMRLRAGDGGQVRDRRRAVRRPHNIPQTPVL